MYRLEFDAYRSDLEELSVGPRDAVTMARIEAAQEHYQVHKEKYERFRSDVTIKLKFLEENKVSLCDRSPVFLFFVFFTIIQKMSTLCDVCKSNLNLLLFLFVLFLSSGEGNA